MDRQEFDHSLLEGIDVDIETSLKEYHMAWIKGKKETLFYFATGFSENEYGEIEGNRFDFCAIAYAIDIIKEYDWIDWKGIYDFTGTDAESFLESSLPMQIFDLVQYYGVTEIFGESYYKGLTYEEVINPA